MLNKSQKPPSYYVFVLGFALFAIFFGAGNLIFPPWLGKITGDNYWYSILGFLLTGVGLPFMGIIAVAKAEGGIDRIAAKVDNRIAKILSVVIMLAIGPLLAIPRTCATTFELGIIPNISWMNSWFFSFIFFGIVLIVAFNPLSVIDRIGKILTPVLLIALLSLIIKGIIHPIAEPIKNGIANPFGKSLIEGYQTMDLIGAAIFGIIILNEIRSKGIFNKKHQLQTIVKAGIIAAVGLAVVYSGLLYLGATASSIPGDITRTELLIIISRNLLGGSGSIVLGLAVSMACLTTAIGLTVVCGQYFHKISYGKLSYKTICFIIALLSLILSNAGVEMIVKIAVPLLVTIYPVVMVLIILTLFGDKFKKRNIWRGAVAGAFIAGFIEAMKNGGVTALGIGELFDILPLTHHGLGWVAPSIALALLGSITPEKESETFRVLSVCPSQLFTRVAIFENENQLFSTAISNSHENISNYGDHVTKIKKELISSLNKSGIDSATIDAVVSRGGFLHPLPGGTYKIDKAMLQDLKHHASRKHPSNWGAAIAYEIAEKINKPSYIVDPVIVDEMIEPARISGLPEIKRTSIFHASDQKAVARKLAKNLWKKYEKINVIVAHIGEGTSVGAHMMGKVIDVNNALDGDGPFSAINAGSLPTVDIVKMCFKENANQQEILNKIRSSGGLKAYLGTTNVKEINEMIFNNNAKAKKCIEYMGYQVSKEIGALSTAMGGRVDAIGLTGELAGCHYLSNYIKSKVRFLAPVFLYPGESEVKALVLGTLRVLRKENKPQKYTPYIDYK